MEKPDIMIDIETLSTKNNAVILTIGAIKFKRDDDIKELKDMESFYIRIRKESCIILGMDIDKDTELWWSKQTDKAKYEVFVNKDRIGIKDGLIKLAEFVKNHKCVWSHSPSFDCVILENAYSKCNLQVPWKFWNLRDTRTLYDLGKVNLKLFSTESDAHNSLFDAYNQVKALNMAFKNLEKKIEFKE